MFILKKIEGSARRGLFRTPHGDIETPFFMNVGTAAAIKGGISSVDLRELKTRVELATPTICIFAPAMMLFTRWAVCISL